MVLWLLSEGFVYWMARTEAACWRQQAAEAFERYGSLKTRADVLQFVDGEGDPGSDPAEVVEKYPNGCTFGSNAQTVLRFSFDNDNKLTAIRVYRDYIAADPKYRMKLVEERKF